MRYLAVGFVLLIVTIVIAADGGRLPGFVYAIYKFPGGDKVGHFFLMGLFAFFVNMAIPLRPVDQPWRSLLLATFVVAFLVTLEEASQGLFRTRTLSLADLFCSYAGIGVFTFVAWRLRQRTIT